MATAMIRLGGEIAEGDPLGETTDNAKEVYWGCDADDVRPVYNGAPDGDPVEDTMERGTVEDSTPGREHAFDGVEAC